MQMARRCAELQARIAELEALVSRLREQLAQMVHAPSAAAHWVAPLASCARIHQAVPSPPPFQRPTLHLPFAHAHFSLWSVSPFRERANRCGPVSVPLVHVSLVPALSLCLSAVACACAPVCMCSRARVCVCVCVCV